MKYSTAEYGAKASEKSGIMSNFFYSSRPKGIRKRTSGMKNLPSPYIFFACPMEYSDPSLDCENLCVLGIGF